jgi:hypothetical protein
MSKINYKYLSCHVLNGQQAVMKDGYARKIIPYQTQGLYSLHHQQLSIAENLTSNPEAVGRTLAFTYSSTVSVNFWCTCAIITRVEIHGINVS